MVHQNKCQIFGNMIALKTSNKMYEPLIDPDHIAAVFKDFSPEQLSKNESSKRKFFKPKSRIEKMRFHEMKNLFFFIFAE